MKAIDSAEIVRLYFIEDSAKYVSIAMERCMLNLRELVELKYNKSIKEI